MLSSVARPRRVAEPRSLSVSVFRTARQSLLPVSVLRTARQSLLPFLRLAALLLLAVAPAPAQPVAGATTIERIVAVVDGRPLLLSDVRTVERVRSLAEAAALEALIDERLMFREAARLPQADVLAEEEERAMQELLERRPDLAGSVSAADLRRLVARQMAILKYVAFRFRPQLRVSDQDVRAAFEADPSAGDSWEEAKHRVRERLERRALDERVEAWVRELRARADVRYVGRAAPAAAP